MIKLSLKAARINAKLSQKYVADKLDIAVSTLRNWESGKTFPKQPAIEQMCKLYETSFDELNFSTE